MMPKIISLLYFILFAKEGIFFLSGDAYEGSILPMQIIMPTLILIGYTNIMGIQMLVPLGREKVVLYSEIAGAIVDLILNAILIPKLGASGAAIGTVAAEVVVWIVQFGALKDEVTEAYIQIKYLPICIAIAIGSVGSLCIKMLELGNFLTLLLSAIVFFGSYGILLMLMKEPLVLEIEKQGIEKLKKRGK